MRPAAAAKAANSSTVYLCEYSVQIVSPGFKLDGFAAEVTVCATADQVISTRPSSAL